MAKTEHITLDNVQDLLVKKKHMIFHFATIIY